MGSEIDRFLKEPEEWKQQYTERQRIKEETFTPRIEEPKEIINNDWFDNEVKEIKNKYNKNVKEFTLCKRTMKKIQKQKIGRASCRERVSPTA